MQRLDDNVMPDDIIESYMRDGQEVTYHRNMYISELQTLADECNARVVFAKSRCQHGYTEDEICRSCEGGYVNDTHEFFIPRSEVFLATSSGDGSEVAYIPLRYKARIVKKHPEYEDYPFTPRW